ncbi:hypothetical protein LUZ60_001413 [Juncus effusus]|nr:hypothetical protein LUZ60_001413 [Juncus effusus]
MEIASSTPAPIAGAGVTATAYSSSSSNISRQWADLNYDLLASIFSRVNSIDLIVGVSSVCSSWRSAAKNPHWWRALDLSDWDSLTARIRVLVSFKEVLDRVLGFVRDSDLIEEFYFPSDADGQDLLLVSERLPKLLYLSFPTCRMPGPAAYSALTNFKSLKSIYVHESFVLSTKLFSQPRTPQFPNLSELKVFGYGFRGNYVVEIILEVFPKLRKLDMQEKHFVICNDTFLRILESLKQLEYLDISGCNSWMIDDKLIENAISRLKVFIWQEMKT